MGDLSKYFNKSEIACPCCGISNIQPETMAKADEIREYLDRPLKITSGMRCIKHNLSVDGKADSEHPHGYALDFACNTGAERYELIQAMMTKGIRRIGVYKDKLTVHMGCAGKPWPQDVLWIC